MPELISEQIPQILEIISSSFVFRKLGVCYDIKALPDSFPRKSLPTANEIKSQKPDAKGSRTGMENSILNNALLFDGYSLRLEIGFADEKKEERIFDRLIGGAIRFAAIGPQSSIIRGLAPDGKSFYTNGGSLPYIMWAFYAWRITQTATVLMESQEKIKNIASRWIARLSNNNFILPDENKELVDTDWKTEPLTCALLAAAWAITGEEKWKKLALEKASFEAKIPESASAEELLPMQIALHMISQILPEEEAGKQAKAKMLQVLPLAVKILPQIEKFAPKEYEDEPQLDWRDLPENGELPESWECYEHEKSTISEAINAALVCVLCSDKDALKPYSQQLAATLSHAHWDKLRLASSLCPAICVHARGTELGLWDNEISEYKLSFNGEASLVSRFMDENFDEQNPEKCGHTEAPVKEVPPELKEKEQNQNKKRSGNKNKRRRRRRRKTKA